MKSFIQDLIAIARHRMIWNGDKIRLYEADNTFIGEYWIKVEGWGPGAAVRVGHGQGAIRRDLPRWSNRFSCWYYHYDS